MDSQRATGRCRELRTAEQGIERQKKLEGSKRVGLNGKGVGGQIEVDERFVTISRKGLMAKSVHGLKGEKRIPVSSISSVQFKKPGAMTNGYIQFSLSGGRESGRGLMDATKDENSVMFTSAQAKSFEAIRDFIEERLGGAHAPQQAAGPDLADQLTKLAGLRDQGILTEEEFQAQKAKLLG